MASVLETVWRELLFPVTCWSKHDQANFPFCIGNKVPLFSKVRILVFLTGVGQHHPCIAVKISSLLITWSQLCSVCGNVSSFAHPGRQKIRMCMENHLSRLPNTHIRNYTLNSVVHKDTWKCWLGRYWQKCKSHVSIFICKIRMGLDSTVLLHIRRIWS